jgi:hypothetical protein
MHSKKLVVKFTTARTYSVRFQKSIESKILFISTFNSSSFKSSKSRESLDAVWCFYAKNESEQSWVRISVGDNNYFPQKFIRNVKSMQNAVKSTVTVIKRWSMTLTLILRLKNVNSTLLLFECASQKPMQMKRQAI